MRSRGTNTNARASKTEALDLSQSRQYFQFYNKIRSILGLCDKGKGLNFSLFGKIFVRQDIYNIFKKIPDEA